MDRQAGRHTKGGVDSCSIDLVSRALELGMERYSNTRYTNQTHGRIIGDCNPWLALERKEHNGAVRSHCPRERQADVSERVIGSARGWSVPIRIEMPA